MLVAQDSHIFLVESVQVVKEANDTNCLESGWCTVGAPQCQSPLPLSVGEWSVVTMADKETWVHLFDKK